jgi:hypothetical protein
MSRSFDEVPIWELRMRIANEIAELRLHYGTLMPPLEAKPSKRAWKPDATRRPPVVLDAGGVHDTVASTATVDQPG